MKIKEAYSKKYVTIKDVTDLHKKKNVVGVYSPSGSGYCVDCAEYSDFDNTWVFESEHLTCDNCGKECE